MHTMIALVGEQPIPNLLPVRHLKPAKTVLVYTATTEKTAQRLAKIIPNSAGHKLAASPYEVGKILAGLTQATSGESGVYFNLTGGTKPMALAAYTLAARMGAPFIYLQSERPPETLYLYEFAQGQPVLQSTEPLPPLINADDYLRAHLPGYRAVGCSRDENGEITDGGLFEQAIYDALKKEDDLEVLAGVRPEGVADQIEVDLVVRCGNRVGIAEVKLGDKGGQKPKQGLDQLATAGGREYLGTYTAKFLIVARRQTRGIHALADARQIKVIELPGYRDGKLPPEERQRLVQTIRDRLCR
jgi:hypothetical protein